MTVKMTALAAEIRKVARENPDVLYQERAKELGAPTSDNFYDTDRRYCRYQAGGQGCCIVGVALANLGVPIEQLAAYDGNTEKSLYGVYLDFPEDFDVDDQAAFDFVRRTQARQDEDEAWGECVSE